MSLEEKKKKKVLGFIRGFLITYAILIIFDILFFIYNSEAIIHLTIIEYYSRLLVIGFITSVIGVFARNKYPYVSKGMIAAIFGPLFLIIKKNGEQFDEPNTEEPKKKRIQIIFGGLLLFGFALFFVPLIDIFFRVYFGINLIVFTIISIYIKKNGELFDEPNTKDPIKKKNHYIIGFLLSSGFITLYLPFCLLGLFSPTNEIIFIIIITFIMNVFYGALTFFFEEKLPYISKGMIFSFPLAILLGFIIGILALISAI